MGALVYGTSTILLAPLHNNACGDDIGEWTETHPHTCIKDLQNQVNSEIQDVYDSDEFACIGRKRCSGGMTKRVVGPTQ